MCKRDTGQWGSGGRQWEQHGPTGEPEAGKAAGSLEWEVRKIEIAMKTGSDHETHGTLLNALA